MPTYIHTYTGIHTHEYIYIYIYMYIYMYQLFRMSSLKILNQGFPFFTPVAIPSLKSLVFPIYYILEGE